MGAAFHAYYAACAGVAGSLTGLLSVSITMRYDFILGRDAPLRNQAVAVGAFTSLVNAFSVSLLVLIPQMSPGWPALAAGLVAGYATLRLHLDRGGRRETSAQTFYISLTIFSVQVAAGLWQVLAKHASAPRDLIAYCVFASVLNALRRSWLLLRFDASPAS
ncbi:MAG TPA: hypothetical protein VGS61_03045 [Acidimicrobiales bacterium]|nr:hypothetical protein [Acidimicrobiales bacterium]